MSHRRRRRDAGRRRSASTASGTSSATGRRSCAASRCSVAPGERVALMGRNGAGKSTLLRHAAGLMTADARARAGRRPGRAAAPEPDRLPDPRDASPQEASPAALAARRARPGRARRAPSRATSPAARSSASRSRSCSATRRRPGRRRVPRRADPGDGPRAKDELARLLRRARRRGAASPPTTPSSWPRSPSAWCCSPTARRSPTAPRARCWPAGPTSPPRRPGSSAGGGALTPARTGVALAHARAEVIGMSWQLGAFAILALALAAASPGTSAAVRTRGSSRWSGRSPPSPRSAGSRSRRSRTSSRRPTSC